jgi:hypothetical protein
MTKHHYLIQILNNGGGCMNLMMLLGLLCATYLVTEIVYKIIDRINHR